MTIDETMASVTARDEPAPPVVVRGASMTSLETSLDDNVVSPGFEARKLAPQPAPGEAGVGGAESASQRSTPPPLT